MSLEDKCTQTAPNEQQRHQCDLCEKSYKHKSHLTYHVKTTHCRKPIYRFFQCRVCRRGRKKNTTPMSSGQMFVCNFFSVWNFVRAVTARVLSAYSAYSRKSDIDGKRRGFRLVATMGTRLRCELGRRGSAGEEGKAEKEEAGGRSQICRTLPRPPKKCDVNRQLWLVCKSAVCSAQMRRHTN